MSRLPVALMSTQALTARLVDLYSARAHIDVELERISATLLARQPREPEHGTPRGYRAHLRAGTPACSSCLAAWAAEIAAYRARTATVPIQRAVNDKENQ